MKFITNPSSLALAGVTEAVVLLKIVLVEGINLKVFHMIKEVNESRILTKYISCEYRCEFDGSKCNSKQKSNNDKCQCESKKIVKHCTCEEDYTWNSNTCDCECDKDCKTGEYLKAFECVKFLLMVY